MASTVKAGNLLSCRSTPVDSGVVVVEVVEVVVEVVEVVGAV